MSSLKAPTSWCWARSRRCCWPPARGGRLTEPTDRSGSTSGVIRRLCRTRRGVAAARRSCRTAGPQPQCLEHMLGRSDLLVFETPDHDVAIPGILEILSEGVGEL